MREDNKTVAIVDKNKIWLRNEYLRDSILAIKQNKVDQYSETIWTL